MKWRIAALLQPLAGRDFRLLWLGQSIALLGDSFYYVNMAWLVLELTGSGAALGGVLMTAAIPRAVLMLAGGAITDRFSSRAVLFATNSMRAALAAILAALIFLDAAQLWFLYVASFVFGVAGAFFFPALFAAVPSFLGEDRLKAGNGLVESSSQFAQLVGPSIAGVLVAATGLGSALALESAAFVFAITMLMLMGGFAGAVGSAADSSSIDSSGGASLADAASVEDTRGQGKENSHHRGIFSSMGETLIYAWKDPLLRLMLAMIAVINLSISGTVQVGIPWLANQGFGAGAAALGVMLSMWGGGAVVGSLAAGLLDRLRYLGWLMIAVTAILGFGIVLLGLAPNVAAASALVFGMGCSVGLVNVVLLSWLQGRSEASMMGRMMSLVTLAAFGMGPISLGLAGVLLEANPVAMFAGAGTLLLVAALVAASSHQLRATG